VNKRNIFMLTDTSVIVIIREIPDTGQWLLYAQILIVRVGALPCSRNEFRLIWPHFIQTGFKHLNSIF